MSDQEQGKHIRVSDDAEETGADVEAHRHHKANEEGEDDGGADVEAHRHHKASDEGDDDGGDDVEAHIKSLR